MIKYIYINNINNNNNNNNKYNLLLLLKFVEIIYNINFYIFIFLQIKSFI